MRLDPVDLEILQHKVQAIAEEMAITLSRTARSTYVKDAADFATALATPADKFFAYPAAMGVSGFLDLDLATAIQAVPDLAPGDVIITNAPYRSGGLSTHMPDLQLIRPWFHDGNIEATPGPSSTRPTSAAACRPASRHASPSCSRRACKSRR